MLVKVIVELLVRLFLSSKVLACHTWIFFQILSGVASTVNFPEVTLFKWLVDILTPTA